MHEVGMLIEPPGVRIRRLVVDITEEKISDTFLTLLTNGNVVKLADLQEAQGIASELSIPLPKAIVMSGVATKERIDLAHEAQTRVETKVVSLDLAIRALRLAVLSNVDLDTAFTTLARVHKNTNQVVSLTNDLTALLLAAKLISAEQLGEAIKYSQDSKLLIGHTLVVLKFIDNATLNAALHAVLLLRQKVIDKDKAAQGLRYANRREITIEQSLFELGFFVPPKAETMRLSELVLMAELLSPADLVECLEVELFKSKPFGQVMLEQGLISQSQLNAAIELQGAVADGLLSPMQAAFSLSRFCFDAIELYQAIAESKLKRDSMETEEQRLGALLVAANVCSQEEMDKVLSQNQTGTIKLGKTLLALGLVKESMLYTALRCQSLLRQEFISAQQALSLITHCHENDASLDQAQIALRIYAPSRMQWHWV